MLRLTDPEEPPTEEFDPDYNDDLGDDMLGVTPYPFVDPIKHYKYLELLVLYFYAIIMLIGCMVVYCFLSNLPCCNLTPAHPAVNTDDNLIMNMGRSWHESWVCGEGRVDQVGSMTSQKDKSCGRMLPRHSPCEVPMEGTCNRERSQGRVSL
jgi:hypothetical protein